MKETNERANERMNERTNERFSKQINKHRSNPNIMSITRGNLVKKEKRRNSLSFTAPSIPSRMLSLLMSLCITPLPCKKSRACKHYRRGVKMIVKWKKYSKESSTLIFFIRTLRVKLTKTRKRLDNAQPQM